MSQYKILSIDGGGTRGIIPATILDCIYRETGKHPTDIFSLLAGTSTGGILCTGLAFGKSTQEMVSLYLDKSDEIFYDTGWDDIRDGFGKNLGADYSNKKFKRILEDIFGDATLHDIYQKVGEDTNLMVCSFDLNPEEGGKPINFRPKVFHSHFIRDMQVKLADLCLMTSAGPTYFPIYQNKYVDGGVSLNNPAMAALAYAINAGESDVAEYRHPNGVKKGLGKELSDLKILSIGCGTSNKNFIPADEIRKKDKGDWGNLQWVKYLPDLLTESNVQASNYYVSQLLPDDRYKRLQLFFNEDDAPAAIRNKTMGLDVKDAKLLKAMKSYAEALCAKEMDNILDFLDLNN